MSLLNKLTIKILQALHGDSLRVRFFGEDNRYHNILIDGGFAKTYKATLRNEVRQILDVGERIDLFVVTHTDQDHISGVLAFIREFGDLDMVDRYWLNHANLDTMLRNSSDKISIGEGITLRDYLVKSGRLIDSEVTTDMPAVTISGASLTVLSPTKKTLGEYQRLWWNEESSRVLGLDKIASIKADYEFTLEQLAQNEFQEDAKLENGVSISLLLKTCSKSVLFLADSHPRIIAQSLRQLGYSAEENIQIDYVKLAHHGSKFNTSNELLGLLDCHSFIISANGNNRYNFPHKEALARVLLHPSRDLAKHTRLIFNYDNQFIRRIFTEREMTTYNFSCFYPDKATNGYTITH